MWTLFPLFPLLRLHRSARDNPVDQNCLRRCMQVTHMAKLSPSRLLQLSVKRFAQYVLARSIGSSIATEEAGLVVHPECLLVD